MRACGCLGLARSVLSGVDAAIRKKRDHFRQGAVLTQHRPSKNEAAGWGDCGRGVKKLLGKTRDPCCPSTLSPGQEKGCFILLIAWKFWIIEEYLISK